MTRPRGIAAVLSAVLVVLAVSPAQAVRPTVDRRIAVLQALDKITARVSRMQVQVGEVASFGTLEMTVRACRSTRPDETPENAVFLEIADEPPGEAQHRVFSGWMFSSSPALSALDHPVFDIWVIRCVDEYIREPEDFGFERGLPLPANPPTPVQRPAAARR